MEINILNLNEAENYIFNILNQGDSRYNESNAEQILADFMLSKAILLEREDIPKFQKPSQEDLEKIKGVQKYEKYYIKKLLKEKGFKDKEILFESTFLNYHPDVLAESSKRIIVGECCSCKVSKIKDFLEAGAEEVWIIIREEVNWLFIFKKGKNWDQKLKEFEKNKTEEMKKIPSPLDNLMKK